MTAFESVKQKLTTMLHDSSDAAEHYCMACTILGIRVDGLLLSQVVDRDVSTLDLSVTYIAPNTLLALCCCIEKLPRLRALIAPRSRLSTEIVSFLCSCLVRTKALEFLDLSYNPFGSEGAFFVYRLTKVNYSLSKVDLSGVEVIPSLFRKINSQLELNAANAPPANVHSR